MMTIGYLRRALGNIGALLLFGLLIAPAQAQQNLAMASAPAPAATASTLSSSPATGYRLGPDDEIKIAVFGQPDLSITTRVASDGTVRLALLGPIAAMGKTASILADDIAGKYAAAGYLTDPSVSVEVSQYVSSFVTVLGNVPQTGNYPLDRPYTVAAMLAKAGGATAAGANAVILTPGDGSGAVRISLADMSAAATRPLRAGDILFVPTSEKIYVYGQVQEPGAFNYVPGQTFRQAIALAGGPTLAGSTRRIKVKREQKEIASVSLDDPIQAEDVLIIPEKLF